jgi:hypothetical protein
MRHFILSLLLPLFIYSPSEAPKLQRAIVSCSAAEMDKLFAVDAFSVADGDFYSGSTWTGGRVPSESDNITISHFLHTNNRNVIVRGRLYSRVGGIEFRGINVNRFKGSGMGPDETPDDIGLWVMGSGQLDLQGDDKEPWTELLGSAAKGSTSITVKSARGWKVGDVIFVCPTETPQTHIDWVDATNTPVDAMIAKFERRTITSIAGNTVFFSGPLVYDHMAVKSDEVGQAWTAEVGNLTRTVKIQGTQGGNAHIFIRSNRPQTVRYVEGRFLGVTKDGNRWMNLVNGRYGLHFHHCMDGSAGSIVEGCAFYDMRNRVYVPHMSNNIMFRRNVAFSMTQEAFWWDFQHQSHYITYDGNLAALRLYNGNPGGTTGFELGQGDGNVAINNVAVYLHHGDPHQQGAYAWNADNVGVWLFLNNKSHSNRSALFVWQNNGDPHIIEGFVVYNNGLGIHLGAYGNGYHLIRCIFYNSLVSIEATQGTTVDMAQECIFDGGKKIPHVVRILSSPTTAGQPNAFRQCKFVGYTVAAAEMKTELFVNENGRKVMDYILPSGDLSNLTSFGPRSIYNSAFRIQPVSGQSYQVTQSGRTNINPWAPTFYGKGSGLKARYFNGANFNSFAFERIDQILRFFQWSYDKGASPNEVHHRITKGSGVYSIVWTGFYQPQFTGQHQFAIQSSGGMRLTVDGKLLLDRWNETNDQVYVDAPVMSLEQGKFYSIKMEHFNTSGQRGFQAALKQNGGYYTLPMSQLYPEIPGRGPDPDPDPDPDPVPNRSPVVNAGPDITTTDTLFKIEGTASDPDKNLATVKWTGPAGVVLSQTLSEAAHVMVKAKPGIYDLRITGTDDKGLTASDNMRLTINSKPIDTILPPPNPAVLLANAGADTTVSGKSAFLDGRRSTGKITAINWYKDSGPASWNARSQNSLQCEMNQLVKGTYVFRLRIRDASGATSEDKVTVYVGEAPGTFKNAEKSGTVTCANGTVINFTVPAGRYTSSTQALADALAIQELNAELAKCPQPYMTFDIDGKKLYVFKTGETYQFFIK